MYRALGRTMLSDMAIEILGIVALIVVPVALFGAAVKWGVDSRFLDVRSDF